MFVSRNPGSRRAPSLPWLPAAILSILLLAVVDWLLLKSRTLPHPPWILAFLVLLLCTLLALQMFMVVVQSVRHRRSPIAGMALAGLLAGVLTLFLGGLANWLFGLQGFVVLLEGEAVPLHGGGHLQEFEGGPLARIAELGVILRLQEVRLRPASGEGAPVLAESRIEVQQIGRQDVELRVDSDTSEAAGTLRFHQGAFGFAPRIVILRGEEMLFDRVVPFTTRNRDGANWSFAGRFTVEEEELEVAGSVALDSLDEKLRGHATLHLVVAAGGRELGRGRLMPGFFADIDRDYRVGFAGLRQWSEIDVSRRHYGRVVRFGAVFALLGAGAWALVRWRGW